MKNFSLNKLNDKSYEELSKKNDFNKIGPFGEISVLNSIQKSLIKTEKLKSDIVKFSITNSANEVLALGLFFQIKINNISIILSGGRFGYSQIRILSKKINEMDILICFDEFCYHNMISLCSLSFDFNDKNNKYLDNSWKIRNINYLMADISSSCDNGKLNFPSALKRTSLSRGIKLSNKNNISSILTTSEKFLEEWYLLCHLPRMKELNGKIWKFDTFKELINSKYGGLCIAKNDSDTILGGCFYVKNSYTIELFMMSTVRINQKMGVNYSLTEKLYSHASESKIKWLNWQASNPPIGPLVDFKKKWNSHPINFNTFSKKFDKNTNIQELRSKITDFFIFPE